MKLILAQPSVKRFQWELEVLLTNIKQFGNFDVVLLFTRHDDTVPQYLADKYGVQCFVYADNRDDKRYIPSVRPYLLWRYLAQDPTREQETYFYIDSDVIFREMPDFATLGFDANTWVGSDCSGYLDYGYIATRKNGPAIAEQMATICGITVDQMKGVPGIGAHIVMTNPTARFWLRAYEDSNKLYDYFNYLDSDIQKWTAEMWAQLWGMVREGKTVKAPSEMDFCMATDNIKMWDIVKIMHNAGVTGSDDMFFKGNYADKVPFGENFDHVRHDKVSRKYVEAIEKVIL